MSRYYSFICIYCITLLCIDLSADELDLSDKFAEVMSNNLECTQDSFDFIESDVELRKYFDVFLDSSVEMGRSILLNYCSKNSDKKFFIKNSKEIFKNLNEESSKVYFINISQAFRSNTMVKSKKDLLFQLKDQLLLFQNNINSDFINSENWGDIIYMLAAHIQWFSNTSWTDDDYSDSISNHESIANTYLSILERLILNTISSEQSLETLNQVAVVLMEMRVLKLENLDEYGSSKEIFAEREYFLKTYLNKYKDGYIEYSEFNEIINNLEILDSQYLLQLELSLGQATYLADVATYSQRVGFEVSKSQQSYQLILGEIIVKNFNSNPMQALSSLATMSLAEINYCPLMEKSFDYSPDESESLIAAIQLPISKYFCSKDITYLIQAHDIAEQILADPYLEFDKAEKFYSFLPLFQLAYKFESFANAHGQDEFLKYLKRVIEFNYIFLILNFLI